VLDWLQSGWEDPNGRIEVVRERNTTRGFETVTVSFSDDPVRIQALEEWRPRWERWAEAERPARAAMRVFERLYELRSRIELESERVELMLGDGRLQWKCDDGDVDHPVLLQRVELEFDPDVPEIRLVDADRVPELYGTVIDQGQGISSETFGKLRRELERGGYHPLSGEPTSAYLKRLVQLISPRGAFREESVPIVTGNDPVVSRDPALFLRVRVSGFPAAFERVLEDLEHRDELPVSITRLVGVTPPADSSEPPAARSPWGEPPDILLSKPANPEQVEVARALERHRAVIVQGPPGTGKSHTIANLIGHLVAHGKRVLVTSHTTKALRVLRGQLPETLRPLCVAVLENDLEARAQMEQSVREILSRLTTVQEATLEHEVADFGEQRTRLNGEIDDITRDLQAVREAEYRPIVIAGQATAPSDGARWVRDSIEGNDWIPSPLEPGAPIPLDPEELAELYGISARITSAEEGELGEGLPDLSALPDLTEFRAAVEAIAASEKPDAARFWSRQPSRSEVDALQQLFLLVTQTARDLGALQRWQRQIVAAGYAGGPDADLWRALQSQVQEAVSRWEKARPALLDHAPEISLKQTYEQTRTVVAEIVKHLESGGSLGSIRLFVNRKWKALVRGSRVNGQLPSTAPHFRALATRLSLEEGRRKLALRWARQAEPLGLAPFTKCGDPPEPALHEYSSTFESLLGWWRTRWNAISDALKQLAFKWDEFRAQELAKGPPAAPFDRDATLLAGPLPTIVGVRLGVARRDQALELLRTLEVVIESHRGPLCSQLLRAVQARNPEEYDAARNAVLDLAAKQELCQRRGDLLRKLGTAAAEWARAVRARDGVHGEPRLPGDVETAWRWRQLRQEIDRRAALDEIRLAEKLNHRRGDLRDLTVSLIDRRAWLGQKRRTDLHAQQALQGWADTQKKIGKGTGKRVPELQARARELLAKARDAVPVWIMPLNRVAESFDPRQNRFDVVIVDEASQADVSGLLCWYLGDRIAVVGDHEQVSPLAVGQQIGPIQQLINEHLAGIPNSHLYDGTTSIYHLARMCFGGAIALREHFRCVPDIIEFSNRLSYDNQIRPLRNPTSAQRPHVVEYVVDATAGSERTGKTNMAEARVIAALVKAVSEAPEYEGQTVGAISLLGDEQAGLIQDLTVGLVGAVELERRRFAAGNAAQFQGDERHVMFLSMVHAPTGTPLRLTSAELYKQRYNVAASRAKDQLWVVHSLDPNHDLKAGDLRRALIEHARDPSAKQRAVEAAQRRAESPFETAVIERLINAGYRLRPQVWVGHYRIDMVVEDGANEVALECDGDRYHGLDQIPADMVRQAILERAGWRFIRVRGTRFFRDPERTTAWIVDELQRLGVQPAGSLPADRAGDVAAEAFRERVVRRAHEIMRECGWLSAQGVLPMGPDEVMT
jgi:very-short-patch-repair endonuclease